MAQAFLVIQINNSTGSKLLNSDRYFFAVPFFILKKAISKVGTVDLEGLTVIRSFSIEQVV